MMCREFAWISTCCKVSVSGVASIGPRPAFPRALSILFMRRCAFTLLAMWLYYIAIRLYTTRHGNLLARFLFRMGVMSSLVDTRETYKTFSDAVIAQVNAEIARDGLNRSVIAKRIDIDYGTLSRYLKNERPIPILVFYAVIDQLKISESELFRLARERFEQR